MKDKEKIIGSICILVLAIVFLVSGYLITRNNSKEAYEDIFIETKDINSEEKGNLTSDEEFIVVDIKGKVKNPREYTLKKGSRVRDLINMAGGLTEEADTDRIHFSKTLNDEDCIVIYGKGDKDEDAKAVSSNSIIDSSKSTSKININKATAEELTQLSGIGPSKAKAIIEYRTSNNGFKSIDELKNVDGIGEKTIDKFRDKVDIK
ncbi:MAG: helix-hairpin-helix domain-containing protein [Clostridium argentinense]|uniref:helix-hairpin-helix domain-containing protein n=1 Tax=Clostridium butanoliproducens TaxID=2991837 RepID=UPI001D7F70D3|nr:helix-hairpin-helix domain-containing protein [Clostridium butanoliproducens]MBS5825232.1 helix-hairpin-helix domain-containing protein [Clostridium argentinense]MDU1348216.1 helix-hairpin-helix domain-containing protein [Clostridium argentinense]